MIGCIGESESESESGTETENLPLTDSEEFLEVGGEWRHSQKERNGMACGVRCGDRDGARPTRAESLLGC